MRPADASTSAAREFRRRLWREWIHTDVPIVERRTSTHRVHVSEDWLDEVIDRPAGIVAGLSAAVRESLVGGELPAADRERIIRRAARLGVNRFEATLLIATIQHRANAEADRTPTVVETRPAERSWGVGKLLICVITAEMLIASAGYLWWI